jgi:CubicO group peptidase (beta-lactamase class C family)
MNKNAKFTKTITVLLIALVSSISGAMGSKPTPQQAVEKQLRKFVEAGGVPGLTAALVTPEGTTYYSYGVFADEPGKKLDENTQFRVASISKLLTTVTMGDLIREKKFQLDDRADKYLPPEFKLPTRDGKAVTIRALVSHTSGLPAPKKPGWGEAYPDWNALLKEWKGGKLETTPGTKFRYSNEGMSLLGHVMEVIDGHPYEDMVKARVLDPLGMNNTWVTSPGEKTSRSSLFAPAGGFSSNAVDLAKFAAGAVGKAPASLLESMELTYPPQGKDRDNRPLHLGWNEEGNPRRLSHCGRNHAYLGIDLDKKVAVVIICTEQTTLIGDLGFAAVSALGGAKVDFPHPRRVIKLPAQTLEKYTGIYRDKDGGLVTVTSNSSLGILELAFAGQGKSQMWAEKEDSYYCKEWSCEMKFPALVNGQAPGVSVIMPHWTGEYTRTVSGK